MKKLSILFFALSLIACQSDSMSGNYASKEAYAPQTTSFEESVEDEESSDDYFQGNGNNGKPNVNIERKIIRTADFRMRVDNVEKSTTKIEKLVQQKGGFISAVDLSSSGSYINNRITIRIPNERLDSLIDLVSTEATHIDHKRINANDVTQEFVDIQIRLETKKQVRDRYVEVLKNKAKTVEEILNAEERIRVIQEEIEAKEGRLRYLSNQVSLSTINLNIYQRDAKGIIQSTFGDKLARAFANGWDNLKGFVLVMVNLWPFWILFGIILYLLRKWRFKRTKKV